VYAGAAAGCLLRKRHGSSLFGVRARMCADLRLGFVSLDDFGSVAGSAELDAIGSVCSIWAAVRGGRSRGGRAYGSGADGAVRVTPTVWRLTGLLISEFGGFASASGLAFVGWGGSSKKLTNSNSATSAAPTVLK